MEVVHAGIGHTAHETLHNFHLTMEDDSLAAAN